MYRHAKKIIDYGAVIEKESLHPKNLIMLLKRESLYLSVIAIKVKNNVSWLYYV